MEPARDDEIRPTPRTDAPPQDRGAGFLPMIVGGLIVAVGLLAFLFYDRAAMMNDPTTTASTRPSITVPSKPMPDPQAAPNGAVTTPSRP